MASQKTFLHFSVLDTMYRWSMMKNIHNPNLVGIGMCLTSAMYIRQNILARIYGKHLWTRPIYTDFNEAN